MENTIHPCLWFDGQAKEAADFYCSLFEDARVTAETPMVVMFEVFGKKFMGLNGGPVFKINPSISFFIYCSTGEEADRIWEALTEDGNILMPLGSYAWSERYGWVADKFGVSWQVMLSEQLANQQKIVPAFLFAGAHYGQAYEAVKSFTSLFPESEIKNAQFYQANEDQEEGKLAFAQFTLQGVLHAAMDGAGKHQFAFNEGVSLVVPCDTQEEIDKYWNTLTIDGEESMCGWLKDKYGISWQIIPSSIGKMMSDPETGGKVAQALMRMKKLDIAALEEASLS